MSKTPSKDTAAKRERFAAVFAALGDKTRLALLKKLGSSESPVSIGALAEGTPQTRQAITKHLRVLERVGLVRSRHVGREALFTPAPAGLDAAQRYLAEVSRQWDDALLRLKAFAEK